MVKVGENWRGLSSPWWFRGLTRLFFADRVDLGEGGEAEQACSPSVRAAIAAAVLGHGDGVGYLGRRSRRGGVFLRAGASRGAAGER